MKLNLIFFICLATLSACSPKESKGDALEHLDKVMAILHPLKTHSEGMNEDIIKYFKRIWDEREALTKTEYEEFKDDYEKFHLMCEKAKMELKNMEEHGDKVGFKMASLKYIDAMSSIDDQTTGKILEVSADFEITDEELKSLNKIPDHFESFNKSSREFSDLQNRYYIEFDLKDEEIDNVFSKYDL